MVSELEMQVRELDEPDKKIKDVATKVSNQMGLSISTIRGYLSAKRNGFSSRQEYLKYRGMGTIEYQNMLAQRHGFSTRGEYETARKDPVQKEGIEAKKLEKIEKNLRGQYKKICAEEGIPPTPSGYTEFCEFQRGFIGHEYGKYHYGKINNESPDEWRERSWAEKFYKLGLGTNIKSKCLSKREQPDNNLQRKERVIAKRLIRTAMTSLNERERQVIQLRFWQGLTLKQISDQNLIKREKTSGMVKKSKNNLLSYEAIHIIEKKALAKMKKAIQPLLREYYK